MMDVFRAGATLWGETILIKDWRADFEERLTLTPLPETSDSPSTPPLSPQTSPGVQIDPLPDVASGEEATDALLKAKNAGQPLSGLTESELMPKKALEALEQVLPQRRTNIPEWVELYALDAHSLANYTDEALFFYAGTSLVDKKLREMADECSCDACVKCEKRMAIANGSVRLDYKDLSKVKPYTPAKWPSGGKSTKWGWYSFALLNEASALDVARVGYLSNKNWTERTMRDFAPRLEPYLWPQKFISRAALHLEDRLKDESAATRRRQQLQRQSS